MTDQAFQRDANHVPITNLGLTASKSITYVASTTGAVGETTLFTVTGTVAVNVFGLCTTDLTGSGTLEIGVTGGTASLCDQQSATAIDDHEVWNNAVIAVGGQVSAYFHVVDQDIIQTIASDTVESGAITFYCTWTPLTEGASVVAS